MISFPVTVTCDYDTCGIEAPKTMQTTVYIGGSRYGGDARPFEGVASVIAELTVLPAPWVWKGTKAYCSEVCRDAAWA